MNRTYWRVKRIDQTNQLACQINVAQGLTAGILLELDFLKHKYDNGVLFFCFDLVRENQCISHVVVRTYSAILAVRSTERGRLSIGTRIFFAAVSEETLQGVVGAEREESPEEHESAHGVDAVRGWRRSHLHSIIVEEDLDTSSRRMNRALHAG